MTKEEKNFKKVLDILKVIQEGYEKAFHECDEEKHEAQKAYYKGRNDGMKYCIEYLEKRIEF